VLFAEELDTLCFERASADKRVAIYVISFPTAMDFLFIMSAGENTRMEPNNDSSL
jgi:hypothetical protein